MELMSIDKYCLTAKRQLGGFILYKGLYDRCHKTRLE